MFEPLRLIAVAMPFVALLGVAPAASAQQTTIPTAEATSFLGTWSMPVDVGQPLTLTITIEDQDGQAAASVVGMAGTPTPVERITRSDEALVLEYEVDLQGQQAPIRIRLTPSGDTLSGTLDVADGMLTANGTATRQP